MMKLNRYYAICSMSLCLGVFPLAHADDSVEGSAENANQTQAVENSKYYGTVNGEPITYLEYNAELTSMLQNRYYHGKVPEGKEEETRQELTNNIVERKLLIQDADKRGIKPDEEYVNGVINKWQSLGKLDGPDRNKLIRQITEIEGKRSQLNQLEQLIRGGVPEPTEEQVKHYYDEHPDLFTEPEKLHLSVILVSVDPSSPVTAWATALTEARGIYNQLKNGADFAELARKVSGDKSAANGGDLGYLHRGMLPKGLEDKVDNFVIGEPVEPIKMLEGMAVFRLNGKIPPNKVPFENVSERARALLIRENQDKAWKDNLDRLHSEADVQIFYIPKKKN